MHRSRVTPSPVPLRSVRGSFGSRRRLAAMAAAAATGLAAPALAAVGVHVSTGKDLVRPGERIDLEVTVTNGDSALRSDVVLSVALPADLQWSYWSDYEGTCPSNSCDPGETLTVNIPLLAPGGSRTFRYPFRSVSGAPGGSVLEFPAEVWDDGDLQASATGMSVVDPARELELAVTDDRDPVEVGGRVTYTIGWGLRDSSPGSPATTLEFPVPAGATIVSMSDGAVLVGDVVTWSLGSLSPGTSGEQRIVLDLDPGLAAGSMVAVNATLSNIFAQSVTATEVTPVAAEMPLEIVVSASPDPVRPGEQLDFEVTVTNRGSFDAFDVVARLDMPQTLAWFYESGWEIACASNSCDPDERGEFAVGDLAAGEGRTFTLPISLVSGVEPGRVVRFDADVLDSFGFQRSTSALVRVDAGRGLELALVENRDPALPGESVVSTVTWGLRSTAAGVFGAEIEMPVPGGMTFDSATDGGVLDGDVVRWPLGVVAPGDSGELRATFTAGPLGNGTIVTARAEFHEDAGGRVATETATRVAADLPLELSIVASPDPARPGETLDLEVTLTNRGALPRFGTVVRVDMPDEAAWFYDAGIDGDCPSTSCDPRERILFSIPELAAGAGRTWTIPVSVASTIGAGRVVRFEAEVVDDSGALREFAANVPTTTARTAELALVESDDPVRPGDDITYTLTWGSLAGGDGATDAGLALRLPAGTTFVSATDGGFVDGDLVRWPIGIVNPGRGSERRVTVAVSPAVVAGTILEAEAWFDGADGDIADTVRFGETTRVATELPLDVEITARSQPAAAGADLDIEVSVRNDSALPREGVVIRMEYAADLGWIYDSGFEGDCPSTSCDANELVSFTLGTLEPGAAQVFVVPSRVLDGLPSGTIVNLDVDVIDAAGFRAHDGDAFMVGTSFQIAQAGDVDGSGSVNLSDLLAVLASWGPCDDADTCPEDFSGDGQIGIADLLIVLSRFE